MNVCPGRALLAVCALGFAACQNPGAGTPPPDEVTSPPAGSTSNPAPPEPGDMAAAAPAQPDLGVSGPPVAQPDLAVTPPPPAQGHVDPFGVAELHPTKAGGREWFLPADATQSDAEWQPSASGTPATITKVSPGVFHTSGAPRMMVVSPAGKAWWRNVEMTAYVREVGTVNVYSDQEPHWTMFARSEAHANDQIAPSAINGGNLPPPGTPTWPGFPFNGYQTINHSCLASTYHGLFYPQGKFILEKEITHTEGYAAHNAGQITVPGFQPALDRWIGLKYVLRNMSGDKQVKQELYVDDKGDGSFTKVSEASDTGNWTAGNPNLNGCTAAPFNYSVNEVVTWAGPWAAFRVDNLSYDMKWMSVREVDPLP
jgi:hypothetical protein